MERMAWFSAHLGLSHELTMSMCTRPGVCGARFEHNGQSLAF
jgi:hypothetical protein